MVSVATRIIAREGKRSGRHSARDQYIEGVKEKMEFKAREQQVSGQCTEFALKFGKFYPKNGS